MRQYAKQPIQIHSECKEQILSSEHMKLYPESTEQTLSNEQMKMLSLT